MGVFVIRKPCGCKVLSTTHDFPAQESILEHCAEHAHFFASTQASAWHVIHSRSAGTG